jgi:hypothetical protein
MLVFVNYLKIGTILKFLKNYKGKIYIYIYIMMAQKKKTKARFVFVVGKFFFVKVCLKLFFYIFIDRCHVLI